MVDVKTMMEDDFSRFGTIISIEMLKDIENEGYITYLHDSSAYSVICAFQQTENDLYTVVPAYTWHQPTNENGFDPSKPIFALNLDCCMEVFQRCDCCSIY